MMVVSEEERPALKLLPPPFHVLAPGGGILLELLATRMATGLLEGEVACVIRGHSVAKAKMLSPVLRHELLLVPVVVTAHRVRGLAIGLLIHDDRDGSHGARNHVARPVEESGAQVFLRRM